MPLVTEREEVLSVYHDAAQRGWVVPTFCAENLTTMEAVLAAAVEHGQAIGVSDPPVTIAITNLYPHRSQTVNYTHTREWQVGLRLFLADLEVLASRDSPFRHLRVMVHLDHAQHDYDACVLNEETARTFSSIMFDASALPFEENMEVTARYVERYGNHVVVEGACDEIVDATGQERSELTTPERAAEYVHRTGVDFIVANLGTEHRASAAELRYHGDVARSIKARIGQRMVLHGCSSVTPEQVRKLFDDGVCKVNIWTTLERDSTPTLFEAMVRNAAKVAGPALARHLASEGLLGPNADLESKADLGFYTTVYRQGIIFERMKEIAGGYFRLWYV